MAEVTEDERSVLANMIRNEILEINTSLPAEIVSYNAGLAVVRPLGTRQVTDGTQLPYPLIYNVPVSWPRFAADQAGVKGPIKPRDKCTLVFSQRALDSFLNYGDDTRNHDLKDAIAFMGLYPSAQGVFANNNDDMIFYFGSTFIKITSAGFVNINGDADNAVSYTALATAFNGLKLSLNLFILLYNVHVHTLAGVGVTDPTTALATVDALDITPSRITSIKVPNI